MRQRRALSPSIPTYGRVSLLQNAALKAGGNDYLREQQRSDERSLVVIALQSGIHPDACCHLASNLETLNS
jgi:hypothetical protein